MTPVQGCGASAGGAIMLFAATFLGIPVSTTHTVTGAIIEVGAARKASAVRWNIAGNIVIAWIITLPATAVVAAVTVAAWTASTLSIFMKLSALGAVVGIAAPAHGTDQTVVGEDVAVDLGSVLRTAIQVMNAALAAALLG
jgi:hypothetical protein